MSLSEGSSPNLLPLVEYCSSVEKGPQLAEIARCLHRLRDHSHAASCREVRSRQKQQEQSQRFLDVQLSSLQEDISF